MKRTMLLVLALASAAQAGQPAVECDINSRALYSLAGRAAELATSNALVAIGKVCATPAELADAVESRLGGPFAVCRLRDDGTIGRCFGRSVFVPIR